MLDRHVRGRVERISPEAPVPVVRVERVESALGGAANVVANLHGLGMQSVVVGMVGDDPAGRQLRDRLDSLGTTSSGVLTDPDRPTTQKTRVTARRQQVVRFDEEEDRPVQASAEAHIVEAVRAAAAECSVLVVEDYDKGVMTPRVIEAVIGAGQALGIPVVVDPKRRHFFSYGGATVFKPNERELSDAVGEPVHADDPEWMERAHRRTGARHLLLTRGEEGMALYNEEGLAHLPASALSVYDVSGAGDTVTAAVAAVIGSGGSIREAVELASAAAAVVVGQAGVRPVTRDAVLDQLSRPG